MSVLWKAIGVVCAIIITISSSPSTQLPCSTIICITFILMPSTNNTFDTDWLMQAGPDLVAFIFCFIVVFLGFTFMGWLLFGEHQMLGDVGWWWWFSDTVFRGSLLDWYSFGNAFLNCFQIFIGNADYWEMQNVNRVLAPIVCPYGDGDCDSGDGAGADGDGLVIRKW